MIKSCEGSRWFDQRNKRMKQVLEWRPFHIYPSMHLRNKNYILAFLSIKDYRFTKTIRFSKLDNVTTHVFAGPLSPGVVLIVKPCGTNISANGNCITMKFSTVSLWL